MTKMKKSIMDWMYNKFVVNDNWIYIIKRIIYIFCFYGMCSLDQIAGSAEPYVLHGAKHYTGVFVAVIILTAYKLCDFKKLPYLIWTFAYICISLFVYQSLTKTIDNNIALIADMIGIGLYGIIFIRMFYLYVFEKKKLAINKLPFSICIIMLLLMAIIRTDFDWTLSVFMICITFYLTDFSKRDLQNLFCGILDGVILGFIVIQGKALLYRPYDKVRYEGYYAQPSLNALFYLCAYYAVLCKNYFLKLQKSKLFFRCIYILLAGFIISTMLFTGSRAAFITAIILTLLFLAFKTISSTKCKLAVLATNSLLIFVSIITCIIPTYWLIRYIPVRVNEPVYFIADELSGLEHKVQKNDPNDSDKYVELGEAIDLMFDRYLWFLDDEVVDQIKDYIRNFPEKLSLSLQVNAAEYIEEIVQEEYIEPGTDREHPLVWTGVDGEGAYDVRIDIYRYFLKKLKMIGERNTVQGVWITNDFLASHCHNVFLQMAYDFGIIVGVIFIGVVMMSYIYACISMYKNRSTENLYQKMIAIGYTTLFIIFGMFEIDWLYGQLSLILFFLMQYVLVHKE